MMTVSSETPTRILLRMGHLASNGDLLVARNGRLAGLSLRGGSLPQTAAPWQDNRLLALREAPAPLTAAVQLR